MELNEIKKALYREKPIAKHTATDGYSMYYIARLSDEQIVSFTIPFSDMGEAKFKGEEPAHLLIRWISGIGVSTTDRLLNTMETTKQVSIEDKMNTEREELEKAKAWWKNLNYQEQYKFKGGNWLAGDIDILGFYRSENPTLTDKEDNNGWTKLTDELWQIPNEDVWLMPITGTAIEYLPKNSFVPLKYASHFQIVQKPLPPKF